MLKQTMQFWPVPSTAGGLLLKNPPTTGILEGGDLCCGVLFLCGKTGVADAHSCKILLSFLGILQYVFAMRNPMFYVMGIVIAQMIVCAIGLTYDTFRFLRRPLPVIPP